MPSVTEMVAPNTDPSMFTSAQSRIGWHARGVSLPGSSRSAEPRAGARTSDASSSGQMPTRTSTASTARTCGSSRDSPSRSATAHACGRLPVAAGFKAHRALASQSLGSDGDRPTLQTLAPWLCLSMAERAHTRYLRVRVLPLLVPLASPGARSIVPLVTFGLRASRDTA